jgi:hypothetical protein
VPGDVKRPAFNVHCAPTDSCLQVAKRLFDIDIVPADGEVPVWHSDVRFFKVLAGGAPRAYFYLDPYSRPAEKRGGAWMAEVRLVCLPAIFCLESSTGSLCVWRGALCMGVGGWVGAPRAYCYLDPYTRLAEKRGGAWLAELVVCCHLCHVLAIYIFVQGSSGWCVEGW